MPEETRKLTYAQAANEALRRALADIPETLLFGEDVALPGGVFGVTKGLQKSFGDRVFDTPISESAILGGAIGAALMGRRPIVEIMWVDFSLVALDQIVNQAANVRYVSQGKLTAPITIRTQQGSGPGSCAQHSQCLETFFAHVPGLQACMPATPQDAYDLLTAAIHSDDPTIVIENRNLYHGEKVDVRIGAAPGPVGGAAVRRDGVDVTLVTWGAMLYRALEAADELAALGVSVEVIDMRWLRPLDTETVKRSVAKTGRLVVAHEAHRFMGVSAEVVTSVVESGVPLVSPPVRVGTPDVRIPAAPSLQAAVIPSTPVIVDAVRRVVEPVAAFAQQGV
jgi:pyruvate/2-oxoglutarate/acetoin dehydrogenase E1 component